MVTNKDIQIYQQIWGESLPRRFPIEVEVDGKTILIFKSEWEDILARVAEEQYEQYMKEANNNAG